MPSRASRAPRSSSRQSIVRRRGPGSCGRCSMARRSWPAGAKSASKKLPSSTTTGLETAVTAMGATPAERRVKRQCDHNTLRHQTTPRGLGSSGLQHMSYVRPYEAHLTDPTTLPCHTVASPRLLYSPFQALYCADPMARRQRSSSELSSSAALHRTRQHGSARSQQASVGRRGASNTCDGPHGDGCSSSAAGRAQEA